MLLNEVTAFFRRFCASFIGFLILSFSPTTSYAAENTNPDNIRIRTLAASCAACHGTNGNSHGITPVLAGLDTHCFVTRMQEFKQGDRESTVMHHHATAFTEEEINLLADYFSQQERVAPPPLKSQTLRVKP